MPETLDRPVTVYVADDNPILLQGLERALSANGYQVHTAPNGSALLGLIGTAGVPDVLLLDVMMPHLDGWAALPVIAADAPSTMVVVLSATLEPGDAERLRDLGAFTWRSKDDLARVGDHLRAESLAAIVWEQKLAVAASKIIDERVILVVSESDSQIIRVHEVDL
jgi:CheY-like chemotaxis protein